MNIDQLSSLKPGQFILIKIKGILCIRLFTKLRETNFLPVSDKKVTYIETYDLWHGDLYEEKYSFNPAPELISYLDVKYFLNSEPILKNFKQMGFLNYVKTYEENIIPLRQNYLDWVSYLQEKSKIVQLLTDSDQFLREWAKSILNDKDLYENRG